MRILFIVHRIPYPPNKGDKIRSYHILRHLSQKHEIDLACLVDDARDLCYERDLLKFCRGVRVAFINKWWAYARMCLYLLIGRPLTLGYFYSGRLHKTVSQWLKNNHYDAIYVFSSGVAQYAMKAGAVKINKIMDFVDVDSDKWFQNAKRASFPASLIYKIEGARMRLHEKEIAANFQHSILITENERTLFRSFAGEKEAVVIPNGVNHVFFHNGNSQQNLVDNHSIVFTGAMDYFANVDGCLYFYQQILPLIREKMPEVKFYIVGSNPAKAVKELSKDKGVVVTGFVEDIRPYLRQASVCVVPLRIARGIQNKILEAMAAGLPVVTTSVTAKNLSVTPGKDIFIEDDPRDFALKVVELLNNKPLARTIGMNAWETVKREYDWDKILEKIDLLLEK